MSADNRYRLYVNGEQVASGPQRSDVMHWRYETIDLAPRLRSGCKRDSSTQVLGGSSGWTAHTGLSRSASAMCVATTPRLRVSRWTLIAVREVGKQANSTTRRGSRSLRRQLSAWALRSESYNDLIDGMALTQLESEQRFISHATRMTSKS